MYRLVDWYDGDEDLIATSNSLNLIADEWERRLEETDGECLLKVYDIQGKDITNLVIIPLSRRNN